MRGTGIKGLVNDKKEGWKRLKTKYGLSRDQYLAILLEQGGVCYICQRPPEKIRPRRNLAVDHDHRTGRVRGLLCFNDNHRLLGRYLRDDVEKAKRIVKYLTRKVDYGIVPNS